MHVHCWRAYAICEMTRHGVLAEIGKRVIGHCITGVHDGYTHIDSAAIRSISIASVGASLTPSYDAEPAPPLPRIPQRRGSTSSSNATTWAVVSGRAPVALATAGSWKRDASSRLAHSQNPAGSQTSTLARVRSLPTNTKTSPWNGSMPRSARTRSASES